MSRQRLVILVTCQSRNREFDLMNRLVGLFPDTGVAQCSRCAQIMGVNVDDLHCARDARGELKDASAK